MTEQGSDLIVSVRESDSVWRSVLDRVTPDQYANPTVNDEWDVRLLISHIIWGNVWTEGYLSKGEGDYPSDDAFGDRSPLAVYQETFDRMMSAAQVPENMDRPVTMPFGETPASTVFSWRVNELVHHAWDLAKATGQETNIAPELTASMLDGWQGQMDTEESRGGQFKMPTVAPEGASPADRLAAYLGKPV